MPFLSVIQILHLIASYSNGIEVGNAIPEMSQLMRKLKRNNFFINLAALLMITNIFLFC